MLNTHERRLSWRCKLWTDDAYGRHLQGLRRRGVDQILADQNFSAERILRRVLNVFRPDADDIEFTEDGFDWWPGSHCVRVSCRPERINGQLAYKLSMSTAVIKDFDILDAQRVALASLWSSQAPTYGWVLPTHPFLRAPNDNEAGTVTFHSAVRVWPDTLAWLPRFFSQLAVLQPIDAERMSGIMSDMLSAQPDANTVRAARGKAPHEEILYVAESLYRPEGNRPSHWSDVDEFDAIVRHYGPSEFCVGSAGRDGLTLETPMGSASALIQLQSNTPHSGLGNGLLTSLLLPFTYTEEEAVQIACELNMNASRFDSTLATFLGSWHPREIGGGWTAAYGSFVPNALYQEGLATNLALWTVELALWAQRTIWPNLKNEKMTDVYLERMRGLARYPDDTHH